MSKHGAEFVSPEHEQPVTFDFANALDKARGLTPTRCAAPSSTRSSSATARRKGRKRVEGLPRHGRGLHVRTGAPSRRAREDGAAQRWRHPVRRRCVGPRHVPRQQARDQAAQPQAQQRRALRPFHRRQAAARPRGRQHQRVLVRARLAVVHPAADGTTSVGAVCWPYYLKSRKTDPTSFFLETHRAVPRARGAAARCASSRRRPPPPATTRTRPSAWPATATSWSATPTPSSTRCSRAACYLAMNSAFRGAEVVDGALRDPRTAPRLAREFDREVRRGLRMFSWMIYRMTSPTMRNLLMGPRNVLGVQQAVRVVPGRRRVPQRPGHAAYPAFPRALLCLQPRGAADERAGLFPAAPGHPAR